MSLIKSFWQREQQGDTIIEVILAMTVLAVILGTAYASTTRSLQNGVDAGNRNKALGYAQEQVEYLKNAANQTNSAIDKYQIGEAFCIPIANANPILESDTDNFNNFCKTYKSSTYSVNVTYSSKVFTVKASWQANNGGQDELKLYYKVPGVSSSSGVPGSPSPPGVVPTPPTAGTENPGNFTPTSAIFHGWVDPNGSATTFYFQYHTCIANTDPGPIGGNNTDGCNIPAGPQFWSYTAPQDAGSGKGGIPTAQLITGLTHHTAYLYRIVAVNGGGMATDTGPLNATSLNTVTRVGTQSFWTPT